MAGLGDYGAPALHIAVAGRRSDPDIDWHVDDGFPRGTVHGMPCQRLDLAIEAALPYMDPEKTATVLDDAVRLGILDGARADRLHAAADARVRGWMALADGPA